MLRKKKRNLSTDFNKIYFLAPLGHPDNLYWFAPRGFLQLLTISYLDFIPNVSGFKRMYGKLKSSKDHYPPFLLWQSRFMWFSNKMQICGIIENYVNNMFENMNLVQFMSKPLLFIYSNKDYSYFHTERFSQIHEIIVKWLIGWK